MKKIALGLAVIAAMAAMAAAPAFAHDQQPSQAAGNVTVGVGGFATGVAAVSTVSGSYNAQLNGPGAQQGAFIAGNQSFADTSTTFGTTQSVTTSHDTNHADNGQGNNSNHDATTVTQSTQTGFDVAANAGSENFGSEVMSSNTGAGSQMIGTAESGVAGAATVGIELVGGTGGGFSKFPK